MKAIHNISYILQLFYFVVINHKTTKFESNSQLVSIISFSLICCYQSQNYKIWKQFTTGLSCITFNDYVVINHKTTKFESNSQRNYSDYKNDFGCYQSQNYKIWKQFTTLVTFCNCSILLLSITKLQNLKAIHNHLPLHYLISTVVINHKTTKFESNSQPDEIVDNFGIGCYQSQNYKIWKQFTTPATMQTQATQLLSITKLQNLKAIHNNSLPMEMTKFVVINHKTTKFESNSQRVNKQSYRALRCYQSQNYKIWKQFTTKIYNEYFIWTLLSITKLQNLKAIHNWTSVPGV